MELIDAVAKLVKYHMAPGQFVKNGAKAAAYKRLANKLSAGSYYVHARTGCTSR